MTASLNLIRWEAQMSKIGQTEQFWSVHGL